MKLLQIFILFSAFIALTSCGTVQTNKDTSLPTDGNEYSWLIDDGRPVRERLRDTTGVISGINGVWRPPACGCGPCDAWIWSEGNFFFIDAGGTGSPASKGIVGEMTDVGLYTPEHMTKSFYVKKYIITESGSGKTFTFSTYYDQDKNEVTVIQFEYQHDGSKYRLYRCSNF